MSAAAASYGAAASYRSSGAAVVVCAPSQGHGAACKLAAALLAPPPAAAHPSRPPPPLACPPCSLRKLAAPKVTPVVLVVTYAGWLTSLSVVALVPIDVYTSLAGKDTGALSTLWSISYWCGAGGRVSWHHGWALCCAVGAQGAGEQHGGLAELPLGYLHPS